MFFKWTLISLPLIPVVCIGVRIVGLIRQLLTLRGLVLVTGIVTMWQVVPEIKELVKKQQGLYQVITENKVIGFGVVGLVLVWWSLLEPKHKRIKRKIAFLEKEIVNQIGFNTQVKGRLRSDGHVFQEDDSDREHNLLLLKNRLEDLKSKLRFS